MNITSTIDLVAGMIFIYFILSLVCNSIFEAISAWRSLRAKLLEQWILNSFPAIAEKFYDHTLINGLSDTGKTTSYISAQNFYNAFLEIVSSYWKEGTVPQSLQEITQMLDYFNDPNNQDKGKKNIIPQDLQRALRLFIAQAQSANTAANPANELQLFQKFIENWFDSMMQRLTGNYKRRAMKWTTIVAAVITIGLNINSVSLVQYLASDDTARANLAQAAYRAANDQNLKNEVNNIQVKDNATETDSIIRTINIDSGITITTKQIKHADSLVSNLSSLIPIGWTGKEFATFCYLYGYYTKTDSSKTPAAPVAKTKPVTRYCWSIDSTKTFLIRDSMHCNAGADSMYKVVLRDTIINGITYIIFTPDSANANGGVESAHSPTIDRAFKADIAAIIKITVADSANNAAIALKMSLQKNSNRLKNAWNNRGALGLFSLYSVFGWLITIFALSMGAPFWFDLLGQIASLRSSVKPATSAPVDMKKKKEEDAQ